MSDLCHQGVLMADDDQDDCFIATEAFADIGAEADFTCVEDGKELIDRLLDCHRSGLELPDLILLDLNMPRVNGHEALKAIRTDRALQNIPVVILTTSSEDEVHSATKEMADGFITKPHSMDGWFEIMKSLAERWII